MKVLIFTSQFFEIGGIERLAVELAIDLNKQGVHADILCMYSENLPAVRERKKEILALGVPNVFFLGLNVHPSLIEILKGIFNLNQLIRKNDYDIVETSALTPIVICSFGTMGTKCRQIAGIHQVFLKERDNLFQHKVLRLSIFLNKKIKYYAVSKYAQEKWIEYSNSLEENTSCVYNSINDDYFTTVPKINFLQQTYHLPDNAKVIIYVGRLIEPKCPDLIIEALSDLCEENNLAILFIGRIDATVNGTEAMVAKMKLTIFEEKLSNRIKFIGSSSEVHKIMAAADLMVHPTQIEAFGLVLVEAMACGLQIVTTNVEGIPEVLRNTDNIMVDPNNPNMLRNGILTILNRSEKEVSQAILKGKKKAELFRTKERTKNMVKLFQDIIFKEY